jgi:lipid-binding SYLF domain-containing protein
MKRFRGIGKIALVVAAVIIASAAASEVAWAKTAKQINSEVNACLDRFYRQVPGSKEMAAKAKGVLVMPGVIKAGLIVGGEYGEGAMRVDKKSVGYYNIVSGSVGLQIGAEDKDIVILFMTD